MTEEQRAELPTNDPTNPAHRLASDLADGEFQNEEVAADIYSVLATIARLEAESEIVRQYEAHDWWKAVVGGDYKPSGAIPSIKHLHPTTLKEVFDRHTGTEVSDVICALLFKLAITENREQFLTKYERDRADEAEARLSSRAKDQSQ